MTMAAFDNLLNQASGIKFMFNSYLRDTYIMRKTTNRDRRWYGGQYLFGFEGGQAVNYQSGGEPVPMAKIARDKYVKGSIATYKKLNSAIQFYNDDIVQHGPGAMVPRDTLLRQVLSRSIMRNRDSFSYMFGLECLNGAAIAKVTSKAAATGQVVVDHPERLNIGQRIYVTSVAATGGALTSQECWIKSININTGVCAVYTDMALTTKATLNTDTYDPAHSTVNRVDIRNPGNADATHGYQGFTPLRDQLFSAADGGSTQLFGVNKADYPYLQSIGEAAGSITTRKQFLFKLYDAYENLIIKGQPARGGKKRYVGRREW